jgi:hypothetical protein
MVACGILCRQLKYGASAGQVCVRLQGSSTKVAPFRNAELFGLRERRESRLVEDGASLRRRTWRCRDPVHYRMTFSRIVINCHLRMQHPNPSRREPKYEDHAT